VVKCAWLIFIRFSSKRLPGKCFEEIDGLIILERICNNLRLQGVIGDDIFLCTSDQQDDQRIALMAQEGLGIQVVRGSLENPVLRYFERRQRFDGYKYIARINGDSPFFESKIAIDAMKLCERHKLSPDVISNILDRQFPSGMSIEVYLKTCLDALLNEHSELRYIEHMSDIVFFANKDNRRVLEIIPESKIPEEFWDKFTVDEQSDLIRIRKMFTTGYAARLERYYRSMRIVLLSDLGGAKCVFSQGH